MRDGGCSVCQRLDRPVLVGLCQQHQICAQERKLDGMQMAEADRRHLSNWRKDKRGWHISEAAECEKRAQLYYGADAFTRLLNYQHWFYWKLMARAHRRKIEEESWPDKNGRIDMPDDCESSIQP